MNPRQIEAFRQVMACGGVSAAARRMNISQPSISRLLTELEAATKLTLFDRRRGKTTPREEAIRFYEEVEKVFFRLSQLDRIAEEIRTTGGRSLRVTGFPAAGHALLPDTMAWFRTAHPGVAISINIRTSDSVIDLVASGAVEIGLTTIMKEHPWVETVRHFSAPCVCIVREDSEYADMPIIDLSQVDPSVLIWMEPSSQITSAMLARRDDADTVRKSAIEVNLALPACRMVQHGLGIAVVDPLTAEVPLGENLLRRRTKPAIPFRLRVIKSRGLPLSRLTRDFIEQLTRLSEQDFGLRASGA